MKDGKIKKKIHVIVKHGHEFGSLSIIRERPFNTCKTKDGLYNAQEQDPHSGRSNLNGAGGKSRDRSWCLLRFKQCRRGDDFAIVRQGAEQALCYFQC